MAHVQEEPSGLAARAPREPRGNRPQTRVSQEEETQIILPTRFSPVHWFGVIL